MTALLQAPAVRSPTPSRLVGLGPNWFASVMGTGIVANAAMLLPVAIPGRHAFALAVWILAAGLLISLTGLSLAQLSRHPTVARGHHRSLAMAPFYGAPAMACLTVGSGALLTAQPLLGTTAALVVDATLWTLGTAGGLACAVVIPCLMFRLHRPALRDTSATWLMAVVAPMVSATAGAGLISHLQGPVRLALFGICAVCFAVSLLLAGGLLARLGVRLVRHGVGPAPLVPTLWIVLGPLGQSVTAAGLLGTASHDHRVVVVGVLYGVPVWGAAMIWMTIAAQITRATARAHLPFSLTWWSFTFPLGTVVTGTSELAVHTHAEAFTAVALVLFTLLLTAWLTVAVRTMVGTINRSVFSQVGPPATP